MGITAYHEFETRDELANALAVRLVEIGQNSTQSSIAFSGGGTPKKMLEQFAVLGKNAASNTVLTLVDERWVDPENNPRSNENMVRSIFNAAGLQPEFLLGLYGLGSNIDDDCILAASNLNAAVKMPLTVVVLGMGTDGHTASWFPGGDTLSQATNPETKALYFPMNASDAGEPRITLTLPPIATAKHLILHIEGDKKRTVLDQALQDGEADDMPVRHILRNPDAQIEVYWAP